VSLRAPLQALQSSLRLSFTSHTTPYDNKMPFAQLVIGPPGSGKSTYCDGMQQFMGAIERKCSVVNLDPANDSTSYQPAVDVRDLVTIDEIMEQETLGPNGGVLFALEELEHNFDWLEEGLKELGGSQQHCRWEVLMLMIC
jgi:GTPase SAR1 family protein